ncbi:hypothetical protein ABT320_01575 [Streptomyces cellulosae]
MSRRFENGFTAFTLTMGLACLGIGGYLATQPLTYLAPAILVLLSGCFLCFLSVAGRDKREL